MNDQTFAIAIGAVAVLAVAGLAISLLERRRRRAHQAARLDRARVAALAAPPPFERYHRTPPTGPGAASPRPPVRHEVSPRRETAPVVGLDVYAQSLTGTPYVYGADSDLDGTPDKFDPEPLVSHTLRDMDITTSRSEPSTVHSDPAPTSDPSPSYDPGPSSSSDGGSFSSD